METDEDLRSISADNILDSAGKHMHGTKKNYSYGTVLACFTTPS